MIVEPIKILIADDHAIVRKGLIALFDAKPGVTVVGEASTGTEAVEKALALKPDVVLLDLVMPQKDGIAAIREIKANDPDARILVLSSFAEDDKVFAAIKGGALGYLLKDSKPSDLLDSIQAVYNGEPSLHPSIALKLVHELGRNSGVNSISDQLSDREMAVLKLIARGLSNQDIGESLIISTRTVTTHVSNILTKLHLANRTQAAIYALKEGIAQLDEAVIPRNT